MEILSTIEDTSLFEEVNRVTNRGTQKDILLLFKMDAFIRVDCLFISPFSLVSIRRGLRGSLIKWEFSAEGWRFLFRDKAQVLFKGRLGSLIKDRKILFIKIESAQVEYTSRPHYEVLVRYLKCLDTFYFMMAEESTSFRVLSNPLAAHGPAGPPSKRDQERR